jgi:uncharacterized membrane protein
VTTDAEEASESHVRRLRLRAWTNRLRESLLFLPLVLLLTSVVVEELAAWVDRRFQLTALGRFALPPDAAVTLLSTVAGATITTAGVVFSLLVVTLQLASGQFSPRVLRTFWRDRFGQVLIGLLLATFTFCVLALTQIDTSSPAAPPLTLALALLLALASILAIVAYLNRITRHQYVGRIVERIAEETLLLVRELPYGGHVGVRVGVAVEPPDLSGRGDPVIVRSAADGWIQQISRRAVVAAVPAGSVVRLETRVGAYLVAGEPVASVWPQGPVPARMSALMREAVIVGNARTMQQDIDFGLRQLNDIALRALSPAVNDPTTAIEVVVRVGSVLRPLVRRSLPDQSVRTPEGTVLLTPWDLDHAEYVDHAFAQLRGYAAPHPQVAMAIVRTLRMLRAASSQPLATGALDRQRELTLQQCERAGLLPADLDAVRAVAKAPGPARGATTDAATGPTGPVPEVSPDAAAGTAGTP